MLLSTERAAVVPKRAISLRDAPRRLAALRTPIRDAALLACCVVMSAACEGSPDRIDQESAASVVKEDSPAVAVQAPEEHSTRDSSAGHGAPTEGGQALLPIMQKLGSEMTALTYALMTDDYETVTRSAAAIAEHVPISAEELERVHTELGADMAAFEAVDESVHVASVRLHEAAQARQRGLIVERLGNVQRGCVSCHTQFRERLRTNR